MHHPSDTSYLVPGVGVQNVFYLYARADWIFLPILYARIGPLPSLFSSDLYLHTCAIKDDVQEILLTSSVRNPQQNLN